MGKMGTYQGTYGKYKNYSLPTSKPSSSHPFFEQKVWTLQEQIFKKLKKVAELLESLSPKLTDDFTTNIKNVIEKNLEMLNEDLDLMQSAMHKDPDSFNTKKLKTNEHRITEMKNVCDTLQTVRSYEREFKKLGKIKHALNELEHLIQPTSFEKSLEKARAKSKPKIVPAKKEQIQVKAKKKIKEKSVVTPKKKKASAKKAKSATKLLKPKKIASKQRQKPKAPAPKLKQTAKKVTKPKTKLPTKSKKALTAKPKSKIKSSAKRGQKRGQGKRR